VDKRRENFKFREELIEIFDVSVEDAAVGAALEDCVDKVLGIKIFFLTLIRHQIH
jgi:hypothetical protein